VSAYKNPSSGDYAIVVVNQNSATEALNFSLTGFAASTVVTPWITSASLNLIAQTAVPVSNNAFSYTVPASSVTTFSASAPTSPTLARTPGWTKILGTTLQGGSENVTQCPPNGFNGYSYNFPTGCFNVIADPNSAISDTKRNRMLLHGGGHSDYFGNEVYALDLNLIGKTAIGPTATGPLYRLDPPAPPQTGSSSVETLAIGSAPLNIPTTTSPSSRHTYGGPTYDSKEDLWFMVAGALPPTGFSSGHSWYFPLANLSAACAPNCDPKWVDPGVLYPAAGVSTVAEYDPGTKLIWAIQSGDISSIDPTNFGAGWHSYSNATGLDYHDAGVLDPDDEEIIVVNSTNPATCDIGGNNNCPFAGITIFNLTGTVHGSKPALDASCTNMLLNSIPYPRVGMEWDSIGRRVVLYPMSGNVMWFIDPHKWVCTNESYGTVQGQDYPQDSVGIHSTGADIAQEHKFGSFPNLDVFPLVNDPANDAWYLNLRRGNFHLTNTSGGTLTNAPVTITQAFRQGDIPSCPNLYLDITGTYAAVATTQTDVKNRWPDGSVKFGMVSFIVPGSWAANQTIDGEYDVQSSCNNTSPQTQTQLLAAGYNFDGQIQLTGTVPHNISARAILSGASGISDCTGTDPDGTLATAGVTACYWLKGPIVTGIILEDRSLRAFDVNVDGATGSPLHPRFEAWFYPSTNQVQLGYTLENTWGSTTATSSARDQSFTGVTLTGGNTSPVTEFTNGAYTQITRTMWHKTFCINGTNAGSANDCNGTQLHIDHNWRYWAATKLLPNWDSSLTLSPGLISAEWANLFSAGSDSRCNFPNETPAACQPGNASTVLGGCTTCFTSNSTKGGIGYYPWSLGDRGSAQFHGPLPTWDIVYLLSQCDAGNSTSAACGNGGGGDMRNVMLTAADLGGGVPYFYREADTNAGHGQTFDNSGVAGNVKTQGRVISINARTQITLRDASQINFCNTNFAVDWITFGGSGQDVGGWGTGNLDMSHWPQIATASYLMTGQYAYYEQEMMQGAYALAGSPGTTACPSNPDPAGNHRQGSAGYWGLDQERANDWQARANMLAASNAVDGSPEKAYFTDKLLRNLSVWEGTKNIPFDMIGPAYLQTDWSYGNTQRGPNNTNAKAGPRGSWTWGPVPGYQDERNFPACGPSDATGCTQPGFGNARFQNAYSGFVAAWIDEQGYCPHPNGNACGFLTYVAPFYLNQTLNPESDIHQFDDYEYVIGGGAPDTTGTPLTSWTWLGNLANYYQVCGASDGDIGYNGHCTAGQPIKTSVWKDATIGGGGVCSGTTDENWPVESLAVMSFLYNMTDAASGYKGSDAYNALYQSYVVTNGCGTGPISFATNSPKWDVKPRTASASVFVSGSGSGGPSSQVGNCNENLTTILGLGISHAAKACKP
jgi:hypothetical protein